MAEWFGAVFRVMDAFPRGSAGLFYLVLLATAACVVFVAAYAFYDWAHAASRCEEPRD